MLVCIIAAISDNLVIGNQGKIPWHLPEDLKYFKKITGSSPIIMGRKTHESIGCVLPNRKNIIISSQKDLVINQATVVNSFEQALAVAKTTLADKVFIIGGHSVYKAGLACADLMYLTKVATNVTGDVYFPQWQEQEWCLQDQQDSYSKASNLKFSFLQFTRNKK